MHSQMQKLMDLSHDEINAMPRPEVERFQLEILDAQFQSLRNKIPALQDLAEMEGIEQITTFEDLALLAFPDKLFKSYDPQDLLDGNWAALTRWVQRFVPIDLSGVDHEGVNSLQSWINKLADHDVTILMSSGTLGTPSFYPRTAADMLLWKAGTTLMIDDALPGLMQEKDLAFVFPSFMGGAQVALYMNEHIAGNLASEGKFHTLYPSRLPADALTLMSRFAHAQATGNQAALAELMPALEKMKSARESGAQGAQEFMGNILKRYMGTDQAVFFAGGAPDVVKMAQAIIGQGITNAFGKFYCLTGGGFKGETPPENWQGLISEAFGKGPVQLLSGKTETTYYDVEVTSGQYLARVFNAVFQISPDGEYLPRVGTQHGIIGNADLFRDHQQGTWGVTMMRDESSVTYGDCIITGIPTRSKNEQGMSCSRVASTTEDIIALLSSK